MARLHAPFNLQNPTELIPVTRRTTDDLPPHVKDTVYWYESEDPHFTGYYIQPVPEEPARPIDYFEHRWHFLFEY